MTYQIINALTGKTLKDCIARKIIQFETAEDAQRFADSHLMNCLQSAAYRANGNRRFRFKVVAA
jgi:hypothetical protein